LPDVKKGSDLIIDKQIKSLPFFISITSTPQEQDYRGGGGGAA
jgi:hypothetical protein